MKLSILIPSKNEPYLQRTIEDIISNSALYPHDLEILAEEDYGLGQRGLTNKLCRMALGEYVMKVDAHCSFGPDFDEIMLSEIDDHTILSPQMGVLDPISWTINGKKMTTRYCFDTNLVMQYDKENENPETMCLQGSAWMVLKENYWKWNLGDETLGSWGSQGPELGIKAFLNGGRCKSTRSTYYGHVFRHSDSDFPYQRDKEAGKHANLELKRRYLNQSIAPLIRKFSYPHDWTPEKVNSLSTPVV